MKKRVLFSACALAVCFAACTNDDFETVKDNNVVANGDENTVVGANLVSKGMKASFEQEGVATRALNGEWQTGDRAGLAWFNFKGVNGDIEDEQSSTEWTNGDYQTWGNPDLNIYANHLFERQENGVWQADTDVYEGAYFGYWPYSALHGVKSKEVHPNNTVQTKTFAQDLADNTFYLSAQDFVAVGDVDENTMILNKAFPIFPMVNAVGVRATPSTEIVNAESDYLRNMVITKMVINAGGTNNSVFRTGGTLVPSRIPKAIDENGKRYEGDDLRKVMDGAAEAATSADFAILATNGLAEATSSLVTTIKSDNYNLGDAKGTVKVDTLRAFAFPIQNGVEYTAAAQYPDVVITVSTPAKDDKGDYKWELGKFAVNHENSADLIETLRDLLSVSNASNPNTWVENILRNPNTSEYTVPRSESMTANLKVNDFTPTTNAITDEGQWNDLVALVQALDDAGKTNFQKTTGENAYEYVEFTLADDVTLNDEIKVPEEVKIQLNTKGHTLTINGTSVDWPVNLVVDNTDKIEVAEGTHLYVGAEGHAAAGEEIVLDANITNNGTIHVGKKASINTSASTNKLTNNNEVIVEYGAYVYPDADAVGIIAFEVKNNAEETMGYINTLIQTEEDNVIDTQKFFAYVNRLIIGTEENVVELDLNAKATSANDDRYNPVDATYLLGLDLIDIVLSNGSVVYDPETAALRNDDADNKNVKNVISRGEGTKNTITDIQPLGDITIEKGSQLSIESEIAIPLEDDGTPLKLNDNATIKNEGTLYVNNTVTTKGFINEIGTAYIQKDVDYYNEYIYYTNNYAQGGLTSGFVIEIDAPGTPYEQLSEQAKAVQDKFIPFVTDATVKATRPEEVAEWWESNKNSVQEGWKSAEFYDAMSTWLTSVKLPALPETYAEGELSVALLKQFETVTGYTLQFTK